MRYLKILVLSLVVCYTAFGGVTPAHASNWLWAKQMYGHYAENEPIRDLLQQFASSINTPIVISDKVKGVVSGRFAEAPARVFIERLSQIHSLQWYYDGQVLYVYHTSEVETALIDLQSVSPERLVKALARLGLLDRRYSLQIIDNEGIVKASGPPRYIELVREVADIILSDRNDRSRDPFEVRVFELKWAWADDRTITINRQTIITPGVASILQSILGRDTSLGTAAGTTSAETVTGLKGQGLVGQGYGAAGRTPDDDAPGPQLGRRQEPLSGDRGSEAQIVANARLNAVIVHDRESRMSLYQRLIESLDKPKGQVEIEVSIIDISTDRLEEVGLEWQVSGKDASFTTSDFSNGGLPRDERELSLVVGEGVGFSTLLNSTQDFFLTRIRALSEEGDASVLSQPTLLTLDNNEAVIDHSTTFHVRLAGEREVDLFPVSVGSVLRVTPHIVRDDEHNRIHLDVNIEDGQQTGQIVDDIPVISKSVISTQALVDDNGSLLVGGYYYNQDTTSSRKVPLLGDIPLLGRLFRTNGGQLQKKARLFLISPKVVTTQREALSDDVESLLGDLRH